MSKLTIVIFRRRESDPYEARVLQERQLGPNLSPKTGTPELARSAATRRVHAEGWRGDIEFIEGLPNENIVVPVFDDPPAAPKRGGLRKARTTGNAALEF